MSKSQTWILTRQILLDRTSSRPGWQGLLRHEELGFGVIQLFGSHISFQNQRKTFYKQLYKLKKNKNINSGI